MYRSSQNIINFLFAFYILANFASLNASSKEDRAKGMVLLSFYGDSLGLPGEFNFDVKQYALGSKSSHYSNAFYNDPWAIWNTSKSIAKDEKGIISDDSYFKLFLLSSYFKFLSDKKRNHSDMVLYDHLFTLRSKPLKSDKQQPWFNAYQEHLSDWFKMYDISQCKPNAKTCHYKKAQSKYPGKRSFYTKKQNICFGLFMHVWHAFSLWNSSHPNSDILKYKVSKTKLDNPRAQTATSLVTALLFDLLNSSSQKDKFLESLLELSSKNLSKMKQLKKLKFIKAEGLDVLAKVFDDAVSFGKSIQKKPLDKARIMLRDKRKILKYPMCKTLKFDPTEFLWVVWSTSSYASHDPIKAMQLLTNSDGDTDTIGSLFGSFWGAYSGYSNAIKWNKPMKKELEAIEAFQKRHKLPYNDLIKNLAGLQYFDDLKPMKKMMDASISVSKSTKSIAMPAELMFDENTIWVDTRSTQEQSISKIPGAISQLEFEKTMKEKPQSLEGKSIVSYCTVGYRSGLYASKLKKQGFDAYNYVGGVSLWAHKGGSFVNEKGSTTRKVHTYSSGWNYMPKAYESTQLPSIKK